MENNENKVVESVSETTNTVMVSEPNSVETPAEKAPAVETPVVEPTQTAEPQPVVIPNGEKPKRDKKKPNPILIILALILLGGACYFEYVYFVKPIINDINISKKTASNDDEILIDIDNSDITLEDGKIKGAEVKALVDKYYGKINGFFSLNNILSQLTESTKGTMAYYNIKPSDDEDIKYADLNASYKELFDTDIDFSKEVSFATKFRNFWLQSENYPYVRVSASHDGETFGYYYATAYSIKDNNLYVVLKYIEIVRCDTIQMMCGNIKLTTNDVQYGIVINDRVYPLTDIQALDPNYITLNYKNMATSKFKLTFDEKDGKYVLISSEKLADIDAISTLAYDGKKYITGSKVVNISNENDEVASVNKFTNSYKIDDYKINSNAMSNFDLLMLKEFADSKENQLFSPLSLKYSLKMIEAGATGSLKDKLSTLTGNYKVNNYSNNKNVAIANALFVKNGFDVKDTFKNSITKDFDAYIAYDRFETTTNMNNWIKENTFNMIDNAVGNNLLRNDYILVNSLSIDMEWINKFQCEKCGRRGWYVKYANQDVYSYVGPIEYGYSEMTMNDEKSSGMPFKSLFNRYDIVSTLGEDNIRNTVSSYYDKYLAGEKVSEYNDNFNASSQGLCSDALPTNEYVDKFIGDIKQNYKQDHESTDYKYYIDNDVKILGKDLKTYDGLTLEFVAVMPVKQELSSFIKNLNISKLDNYINKLDGEHSYDEGYITIIEGIIPTFEYNNRLDVKSLLNSLDLSEMFDKNKNSLSGIADGAYINDVEQKSVITVNNDGIKASTITLMGGGGGGDCGFTFEYKAPIKKIDMTMDKPFAYFIMNKDTKEVWYMGKLYKPTTLSERGGR